MQRNINELFGNKLTASDGDIGHVKDFYFDDQTWVVRYLIVNTGSWLSGRQVLLSPHAFGRLNRTGKNLSVALTRKQIEASPSIDSHKPVSRQFEIDYYRYYGWPPYWSGTAMWGLGGFPVVMLPSKDQALAQRKYHHRDDKHLQSMKAIKGYPIMATDGKVGSFSSFMLDEKSWAISAMVADTGKWYSDKELLIAPENLERIGYEESKVFVKLTKAGIRKAAETALSTAGV
ncbi:PRC-barrel domain protein [mine drainage metagenome]|uniref:PRC-barrel domain protein n=1 Tax=mine drainage metagenome TaxID=410659 RepID=A0A1J5SBG1_9ZZZZ